MDRSKEQSHAVPLDIENRIGFIKGHHPHLNTHHIKELLKQCRFNVKAALEYLDHHPFASHNTKEERDSNDRETSFAMGSMLDALKDSHELFDIARPNKPLHFHTYKLENELQVVLISDPKVTMSAATMLVNVGSMADPSHMQGMAHLVEHALFLGTTKFPELFHLNHLLQMWGGRSNGSTSSFETTYEFKVMPEAFAEALPIFASMFICPLINDRTIMEVFNVDHESRHLPILNSRVTEIATLKDECGTAKSLLKSPLSKGMDFKMEVRKFFKENYSSNRMTLVVIGRDSLEDLAKIVDPLFCQIKNKKLPFLFQLSEKVKLGNEIQIMDWKDDMKLQIMWTIDDSSKTLSYFTIKIIKRWLHENLVAYVCDRDKNCSSGPVILIDFNRYVQPRHILFCIKFDVTTEELKNRHEIIMRVYKCINKLKTEGMDEDSYKRFSKAQLYRMLDCDADLFTYSVANVARDATYLNKSVQEIIETELLGSEDQINLIKRFANKLSPCNSQVVLAYNNPSKIVGGISHQSKKLETRIIDKWNNAKLGKPSSYPWHDCVDYSGILSPPDILVKLEYLSPPRFVRSFLHLQYVELFCYLIDLPFSALVRTEHQTAYSLQVCPTRRGFCVKIHYEGSETEKATLQIKLSAYMLNMHTYLDHLSEEKFAKYRSSLAYTLKTRGETQDSQFVNFVKKEDLCNYAKESIPQF